MSEQKFPDLPDPEEIPRPRLLSSVAYWWIGTFFIVGYCCCMVAVPVYYSEYY